MLETLVWLCLELQGATVVSTFDGVVHCNNGSWHYDTKSNSLKSYETIGWRL